jgi:hypothetical protein
MVYFLKRKWRNEAETVVFWLLMPCAMISLVGGMILGFIYLTPYYIWVGYLLSMAFFYTMFFLGQSLIDSRHAANKEMRETYWKYKKEVDEIREELGVKYLFEK